jgi:hypothetical protein
VQQAFELLPVAALEDYLAELQQDAGFMELARHVVVGLTGDGQR